MKTINKQLTILISIALLAKAAAFAKDINTLFGAEMAALGYTYAGVVDFSSISGNPAHTNLIKKTGVLIGSETLLDDGRRNELLVNHTISDRVGVFVGWSQKTITGIDTYSATNTRLDVLDFKEMRLCGGFGWQVFQKYAFGATVKIWNDTFGSEVIDAGVTADIGITGVLSDDMNGGVVLSNITVPKDNAIRAGFSKSFGTVNYSADIGLEMYWMRMFMSMGLKYDAYRYCSFMLGYKTSPEIQKAGFMSSISAGFKTHYKDFDIVYAVHPTLDIGINHKITIVVNLPKDGSIFRHIIPKTQTSIENSQSPAALEVKPRPVIEESFAPPAEVYQGEATSKDAYRNSNKQLFEEGFVTLDRLMKGNHIQGMPKEYNQYFMCKDNITEYKEQERQYDEVVLNTKLINLIGELRELEKTVTLNANRNVTEEDSVFAWNKFLNDVDIYVRNNGYYLDYQIVDEGILLTMKKLDGLTGNDIPGETYECFQKLNDVLKMGRHYEIKVDFYGQDKQYDAYTNAIGYIKKEWSKISNKYIDPQFKPLLKKEPSRIEVLFYKGSSRK